MRRRQKGEKRSGGKPAKRTGYNSEDKRKLDERPRHNANAFAGPDPVFDYDNHNRYRRAS